MLHMWTWFCANNLTVGLVNMALLCKPGKKPGIAPQEKIFKNITHINIIHFVCMSSHVEL